MTTAVLLARIQFAFTIGYHFLYVPISLGVGLILVLAARRYRKSGLESDRAAADLWTKLFAATFAVGVATGLTMEFAFGTNWAAYSRFVGNIFGAPLAIEGIFSFFIESTFLGVVLFGRRRVSARVYYVSTWLVFGAAVMSAFWIIVANSWMHTPAGYQVENGRAVLQNIWAVIFTKSLAPRFVHTLVATSITGSFIAAGIAAHYLLKRRHLDFAKKALTTALVVGVLSSVPQPFIGHWHAIEVAADQPIKMAAFEGVYETGSHVPLSIYGWVNEDAEKPVSIAIPSGLSLMLGLSPGKVIQGLNSVPPADRPPVQILFQTWHLMVGIGILLALIMVIGVYLLLRKRLEYSVGYLKLLKYAMPLPVIACILGWMSTEIGRQPWIVQGELRTADAVSVTVPASQVATTLAIFAAIYAVLFFAWLHVVRRIVADGPEEVPVLSPAERDERALAAIRSRLAFSLGDGWRRAIGQDSGLSVRGAIRRGRRRDMTGLQAAWFVVTALLVVVYAALDGFDLGVGILSPLLARSDDERATLRHTVGPIWDGNEVWLIIIGGVLFAAFPEVYASLLSGFYLIFMLIFFGLISRATALGLHYGSGGPSRPWRSALWVGSILPGFLFGLVAGQPHPGGGTVLQRRLCRECRLLVQPSRRRGRPAGDRHVRESRRLLGEPQDRGRTPPQVRQGEVLGPGGCCCSCLRC